MILICGTLFFLLVIAAISTFFGKWREASAFLEDTKRNLDEIVKSP